MNTPAEHPDVHCPYDNPCPRLKAESKRIDELEDRADDTDKRLADGDKQLATINTKLNCLIGVLSAVGIAVLGVAVKLIFGVG